MFTATANYIYLNVKNSHIVWILQAKILNFGLVIGILRYKGELHSLD